jgi:hypothetical protein
LADFVGPCRRGRQPTNPSARHRRTAAEPGRNQRTPNRPCNNL